MRKKGRKKSKNFDIKKTLEFRLLMILIVLLIVLVIVYIFVYSPVKDVSEFDGELGTLKWDFNSEEVVLDVLGYIISSDNSTIDVNINWSSGNQSINWVWIDFIGPSGYCNTTSPFTFEFLTNRTYHFPHLPSFCNESDFSNVTNVLAYAQIHVNLTQITVPIPDITIYEDDSRDELVDLNDNVIILDNYFSSLNNISYGLIESPTNGQIELIVNETTHKLKININNNWRGTQSFNLTASEVEGEDVLNVGTSGENMSFYLIVEDTDRPIPNEAPEFNRTVCDDLAWNMSTNYSLNMTNCWDDGDGDSLQGYRYYNDNDNLTITASNNVLKLIPDVNWVGSGDFNIYVNDSQEESLGDVDFIVRNSSVTSTPVNTTNTTVPKIKSSTPSATTITVDNRTQTFTITAEKYTSIKWYLNGVFLTGTGLSLDLENLTQGDVVKVEVIRGAQIDSKTWNINVPSTSNNPSTPANTDLDLGTIVFYMIIIVIVLIIFLTIWMLIQSKHRKGSQINIGFGVSGKGNFGKQTPLNQFKNSKR